MADEATALLSLLMTPGVGYVTARRVLSVAQTRGLALAELMAVSPRKLVQWLPSGWEALSDVVRGSREHHDHAAELIGFVRDAGGRTIHAHEAEYPAAIAAALGEQAPPLLFCRGDVRLLHTALAAVVGTRTPSAHGRRLGHACAIALCGEGAGIVSGGADGVDSVAHAAAVEAESATVVVLPQGLLTYRPPAYLERAAEHGFALILSEFSPAGPWATHAAVTRNATIAALGRLVCVLEPNREGGSMRTGRCGLDQGKPVFCAHRAGAPPALLQAGAHALANARGDLRRDALVEAWTAAPAFAAPPDLFQDA